MKIILTHIPIRYGIVDPNQPKRMVTNRNHKKHFVLLIALHMSPSPPNDPLWGVLMVSIVHEELNFLNA